MWVLRVFTLTVLMVILNAVHSDMHEYIYNIPSDIGNSVNSAWNNIIKAIKRPVRIRRLGRTGRTRTPRTTTLHTTRFLLKLTQYRHHRTTTPRIVTTTKSLTKLVIPVLMRPSWRFFFDWRDSEDILGTGKAKEKLMEPKLYPSCELTDVNKISEDNDSQNFGNLFFV